MAKQFHVWAAGDSHVGTDIRRGRESLADALRQSEGQADSERFDWDVMLDVGDLSGSQEPPNDEEGELVAQQYSVLRDHHRSQIYNIVGNHDASGPGEKNPQWWFRKYGDPLGEHAAASGVDPTKRPFTVQGEWDHYRIEIGNLVVLMMGDRNDGGPPVGRGTRGGYPAGAVTGETFDWWVREVEANQDRIIVSVHHHMLKETTVGSGEWEGFGPPDEYGKRPGKYHGYFPDGGPMGSGYLYWVGGNPDAQAFERYLAANPGAIDLWIGGHTHTNPDDQINGRGLIVRKWDVTFLNCAAMSAYHGHLNVPMSRPLTLTDGAESLRVRCYMHTSQYRPQGFYDAAERIVPLRRRFEHPG